MLLEGRQLGGEADLRSALSEGCYELRQEPEKIGWQEDLVHHEQSFRIEGTNAEQGRKLLAESGLAIIAAADLTDAAKKVVAAAKK